MRSVSMSMSVFKMHVLPLGVTTTGLRGTTIPSSRVVTPKLCHQVSARRKGHGCPLRLACTYFAAVKRTSISYIKENNFMHAFAFLPWLSV
jgi:hypothetical protein